MAVVAEAEGKVRSRVSRPQVVGWLTRVVAALLAFPLVFAALGAGYQATATALSLRAYPAPGQLIDVGGYKLHLYCEGQGSPAVILDAANQGEVSSWAWIQPELARTTRVCAYHRAGAGESCYSPGWAALPNTRARYDSPSCRYTSSGSAVGVTIRM